MPLSNPGLAVDMNFENVEGLVGNRGTTVVHEIGILCTCQVQQPQDGFVGHSSATCLRCFGLGYIWRDPVRIEGLVTNLSLHKNLIDAGWINAGDLTFTPSMHMRDLSDYDRITLTVDIPVEPQVLVRGREGFNSPRLPELKANQDLLYWEASRPQAIWVEDEDGVVYKRPDYQLKGRIIEWTEGAGPAVGKRYSIKYYAFPEFIVFATPIQVWDRARNIGQEVVLRRITLDTYHARKGIKAPWEDRVSHNVGGLSYNQIMLPHSQNSTR